MKNTKNSSTIRDVAKLAGVSVATISRYLNNSAPLSPETASRVKSAMEELDYSPLPAARNLATNRTNTIGLVLDKIEGDYFTPLLDGIIAVTEANNYNLLIFTTNQNKQSNNRLMSSAYTDGLLVFLDSLSVQDLTALDEAERPIVLIHRSSPTGLTLPMVTIENKSASCEIVTHLIDVHHRKRIAFLRGPQGNEDAYWRETGYRQAITEHGLVVDEELIAPGDYDRFTAQSSILELMEKGKQFDAVFAADDDSAIGVLAALKEAGVDVPGQVSVVGFDDQRTAAFLTPPLTTVHAPTDKIGSTAVNQLLKLIRHEEVESKIFLPTQMIIRNSCGCI